MERPMVTHTEDCAWYDNLLQRCACGAWDRWRDGPPVNRYTARAIVEVDVDIEAETFEQASEILKGAHTVTLSSPRLGAHVIDFELVGITVSPPTPESLTG